MGIAELIGVYSEVLSIFTEDHRMRVLNTWLLGPILHMTVTICLHSPGLKTTTTLDVVDTTKQTLLFLDVEREIPKCKPNLLAQKCQDRICHIFFRERSAGK